MGSKLHTKTGWKKLCIKFKYDLNPYTTFTKFQGE